jgi:hypothetical protein
LNLTLIYSPFGSRNAVLGSHQRTTPTKFNHFIPRDVECGEHSLTMSDGAGHAISPEVPVDHFIQLLSITLSVCCHPFQQFGFYRRFQSEFASWNIQSNIQRKVYRIHIYFKMNAWQSVMSTSVFTLPYQYQLLSLVGGLVLVRYAASFLTLLYNCTIRGGKSVRT